MPKRTAIYLRVSKPGQTTENQKRDLTRYCEARNLEITEIFEDHGISGAKESRPALDDLMKKARQRKFDMVLVWKFDRFARSTSHLLSALNEFKDLGIDFISYSEGIDTSTSVGKMVFTFLGAIAEFERSLIQERVQCGINRARENGVKFGRPHKGFDVERALSLREQGYGFRKMAKELNVSVGTLHGFFQKISVQKTNVY